ncbi:replicative DNA helicase [Bacillus wiedmannii]|uniref:replicative DNA helicase n=1 Tax=Bacillus wiedmannii TaxID=1890302 RepID=UPI0020D26B73|nr:replicative DNA helicase [Bacillus wiedmannii]
MIENLRTVDLGAEQSFLGCLLLEGDLIQEVTLQPLHMENGRHRVIYKTMQKIMNDGEVLDLVTMVERLGDSLESIGGIHYLAQLADSVSSTANLKHYQRMIYEQYRIREAKVIASDLLQQTDEENIAKTYNKLGELQEMGVTNGATKEDILLEIMRDINTDRGELVGIDTGFSDINGMTGGLKGGSLYIIAGRPSMGKTAFSLALTTNACDSGAACSYFSIEMPQKDLFNRIISSIGRIDGSKWQNPWKYFAQEDTQRASIAMGEISKWAFEVYDESRQTIADIRAKARQFKKQYPDKKHVIFIDYLGLISTVGTYERDDLRIGAMTAELKQIARSLDVPVVLLAQLSRSVEQRNDKRPMMSDLRGSGSIEQDADLIAFLYRDEYYNADSEAKNIVEVIISKHRNGPTGTVELAFFKEFGKFVDLERRNER